MKLTNLEVFNAANSLSTLSQQKFPVKLSWKIATALKTLQPFATDIEKFIDDIRMKYAIRDESGNIVEGTDEQGNKVPNTIKINPDEIKVLNSEIEELFKQHVEVINAELSLDDFPETFEMEPNVLTTLMPLFENK